jgi:DNA-binding NtrC family response regulator
MIKANVLLVDDEVPFVTTLARRLRRRGFTVSAVYSGEAAIEWLDERAGIDYTNRVMAGLDEGGNAEVVLLDVRMPGLDGIETFKLIRERHPLLEVIMLTGHATVADAIEGMRRGAFDYLMKPCPVELLEEKLTAAAERRRRQMKKIVEALSQPYRSRRDLKNIVAEVKASPDAE